MGAAASLFVDVRANVSNAVSGLKKTEAQLMATGAAAKKVDAQMMATGSSTRKAATGYTMVGSTARDSAKQQEKIAPAAGRAEKATTKMSKANQTARGSLQGLGLGTTAAQGGALALAYGLGKTVSIAANFDSAMRNVNSIAGLSEGQFKNLKTQVNALAGPTAQSPQTLAEGMYQLVSSGFKANEAVTILKSSAIAASAGLTTAETATTAVAGVLNAYHLSASKAAQVSDDLFQTVNLGVLSFEDLAQGIGPVLPFASRLGVDLKQVGAMTSTLTKAGVPAAEAFTYQKGAMAQLIKPTKELKKEYKELGVASGAELVKKTGSLQGALEALWQSSGKNDKAFAKLFPDIRGLSAAFTATGSGAKGAKRDLEAFNNTAGQTKRVFEEQKKGDAFGFKQASADVQQLANTYGQKLSPAISTATKGVGKAAQGLGSKMGQQIVGGMAKHVTMAAAGIPGMIASQVGDAKNIAGKLFGGDKEKKVNVKVTPKVTKMPRIQDLIPGSPKVNQLVTIKANNSDVKKKASESSNLLSTIKGVSPKINVSSNAPQVSSTAQTAIDSVTGKTVTINVVTTRSGGNADTVVNGGRLPGQATGGTNRTGMALVGERGPEIVSMPHGSYVHTASQTRRFMSGDADLPRYATGGKTKGKTLDRRDKKIQRGLDSLDYRVNTGSISDAGQLARLEKLKKIRGRGSMTRDVKQRIYDLKTTKKSRIQDLADQASAIGLDPVSAAAVAQKTASRHLAEAKKTKDKEKIAQAQLEVAEANNDALEAQKAATEANTEAVKAQATAMADLAKAIGESNRIASTTHTVTQAQVVRGITDIFSKGIGGKMASSQRTLGGAVAY